MIESKYLCTYDLFFLDSDFGRRQNCHPGDFRLEQADADLVEVPAGARRAWHRCS